ncbi:MAG TPA: 30S ribosomal protein S20 [Thermodesulfovibrionales bacterium]|nr:30S ribosomal protein S20 [Thermodesulfovibrionales bacterium]
MPAKARPKKNLSAIKKAKQSDKRNLLNKSVRSTMKTIERKVESVIASGNKEEAGKVLIEAMKVLQKASSKGVIHKNNAARKISQLTKKVNAISKSEAA